MRIIKVIAINLIIFAMLAEAVFVFYHFYKTGELFYTRKMHPEQCEEVVKGVGVRLHPYFGHVWDTYNPDAEAKKDYRMSYLMYPVKKRPDDIVIGFFGGSVARDLSNVEIDHHYLGTRLKADAKFRSKNIKVLNFAGAVYKEPVQLLSLTYFLSMGQKLDYIINYDGVIEAIYGLRNIQSGYLFSLPDVGLLNTLSRTANLELPYRLASKAIEVARIKEQNKGKCLAAESSFLAAMFYLRNTVRSRKQNFITRTEAEIEDFVAHHPDEYKSVLQITAQPLAPARTDIDGLSDPNRWLEMVADHWAQCSWMMDRLAQVMGIKYFHFLQVNQHHKTERVYSEQESKIAFGAKVYEEPIKQMYPEMIKRITDLKSKGVKAYDFTTVFDKEPAAVYADGIGHYTDDGSRLVLTKIAETILASEN